MWSKVFCGAFFQKSDFFLMIPEPLEISTLHSAYRAGTLTPAGLCETLLDRIEAYPDKAVFISRFTREQVLAEVAALGEMDGRPLYGIPFVVKDNIDVAGLPTTAACPEFAYTPQADAVAVARLRKAGAIVLGKANLDQFATGLNGTRSPYGAPRCVFDADYVSGGSSSGSAVAVGAGLCVFSLGTDTAGSGRVPAAFNNIVGLKPSIGRIPATGLVPACKSLDCISVFANCAADAMAVLRAAEGYDAGDCYARDCHAIPENIITNVKNPRVGVLRAADRDFAGDAGAAALYDAALKKAASLGWELVEIDYAPFRDIALMLYGSAFAAERLAAVRALYETKPEAIHPVVREILDGAAGYSAADAFAAIYKLQALLQVAGPELAKCDFLLLPTAPTIFSVAEMLAEPIKANAKLGTYTNFVNFMDLAGIAVPAGFDARGLPFGVTLIGQALTEASLAAFGDALHRTIGAGAGRSRAMPESNWEHPDPEATIVVAGAHLSGMVLNPELRAYGARLIKATRTAREYKLFALTTTPPKPGLVRSPGFAGQGIEVELWAMDAAGFGKFVANLPAPMGIGRVTLDDGTSHPGFLCEAHALEGAAEITAYGGWRNYVGRKK